MADKSTIYKYIQRALMVAGFLLVLGFLLYKVMRLVERKDSVAKNVTFLSEAEAGTIDGLFIGSSHVVNGINPAQIYEETGYTIYNLGGHGSTLPVSYWTLVNALDYCTPQYVFIDTYMIEKDYQYLDVNIEGDDHDIQAAVDQLHEVFDVFPDTDNKRAAIADLIQDPDTRQEFTLDFIKYHSRWSSLEDQDYAASAGVLEPESIMGASLRYEVTPNATHYDLLSQEDVDPTESVGKDYMRRIIALCLSREITPVIIQIPFEENEDYQRAANSAYAIAAEYGVPYVNLRYAPNIINSYSDLQSQTHLSAYGSYKVTHYLAQNTLTQLVMTDHRGEAGYEAWESSVDKWHQEILDAASDPADIYAALMILQFEDVSGMVYINDDSALFSNEVLLRELGDLCGDSSASDITTEYEGTPFLRAAVSSDRSYLLVLDHQQDRVIEATGESGLSAETSYGTVQFVSPSVEYNLLTLGTETENLLDYENDANVDVQIFLYNSGDGSLITRLRYSNAGFTAE